MKDYRDVIMTLEVPEGFDPSLIDSNFVKLAFASFTQLNDIDLRFKCVGFDLVPIEE